MTRVERRVTQQPSLVPDCLQGFLCVGFVSVKTFSSNTAKAWAAVQCVGNSHMVELLPSSCDRCPITGLRLVMVF